MIVRDLQRLVLLISPILLLLYLYLSAQDHQIKLKDVKIHNPIDNHKGPLDLEQHHDPDPPAQDIGSDTKASEQQEDEKEHSDGNVSAGPPATGAEQANGELDSHHELFSQSTFDKKYFSIDFGVLPGRNPNIIPHPTLDETWLVVAQQVEDADKPTFEKKELSCNAVFKDGALRCIAEPSALPIAATAGGKCEGDLAVLNLQKGPHDARAFWGPQQPYIVYGSNSLHNCLGQFTQDLRGLVDDWEADDSASDFQNATELQRPPPLSHLEKNWFYFWDNSNQIHVHYDIVPKRVFAKLNGDGTNGPDLAPEAQAADEQCLSKHLPHVTPEYESIHQATNSLLITLCERNQSCVPDRENTIVFTIFQRKTYRNYHAVYEPYVMAFRQHAPFEVYGISRRPLLIHGRGQQLDGTTEMFYITSMGWKNRGQQYHGYMDDTIFLAFGIEDQKMAAMDISAKDLFVDLERC
ncbi:hypothetical protein HJFPF1_12616 [Paramyrothecium foliicola]|nr:hypothetical protein HJFPF1_12616 [Paramyrothecium foliicola]